MNDLAEDMAAKDADLESQVTMTTEQLNANVSTLSITVEGMQTTIEELRTVRFRLIFK